MTTIHSFKTVGMNAVPVTIECDLMAGIGIHLVGLADQTVKESLLRTVTAIESCGYTIPGKKIIINIAPADLRKDGTDYDLPIALAILSASGQVNLPDADKFIIAGELALDGNVRHVNGYIQAADLARREGKTLLLPRTAADLAAEVFKDSVDIYEIDALYQAIDALDGKRPALTAWEHVQKMHKENPVPKGTCVWDSIKGNNGAKRALEIAAAGGLGVLLVGSDHAPKSMLAKALLDILPPMDDDENLEVQRIHSVKSNFIDNEQRPFYIADCNSSIQALLGGGVNCMPGFTSLAHKGVLLLNDWNLFPKSIMEALRGPLEDQEVTISRLKGKVTYPTEFIPILAIKPCPCGEYGNGEECKCTPDQRKNWLSRLSGPVYDMITLQAWVHGPDPKDRPGEPAKDVAARVEKAWERQRIRQNALNGTLSAAALAQVAPLSEEAKEMLEKIFSRLGINARAFTPIIRVARTIADLEGAEDITPQHICEAASYRFLDRKNIL